MKILLLGCSESSAVTVALSRLGLEAELNGDNFTDDISAVFFSGEFITQGEDCKSTAAALCKRCRKLEIPAVFDPDLKSVLSDKERADICEIAGLSEIFLPSLEDAKALCGLDDPEKAADRFLELGARKVIITLDKKGAYFKSAKESGFAPTFRADKVVDTKGAGSAFAAGLISGVIEDIPLGEAVIRANAAGCIAIQSPGELEGLPTMDKLREYMLNHRFAVEGCKEF